MFDLFYVLSVLLTIALVFGVVGFVCEKIWESNDE
jgi:hypothetical protein